MENENEDIKTQPEKEEPIIIKHQGVSVDFAVFFAVLVAVLAGLAGYGAGRNAVIESPSCQLNNATVKAQADAQKASIDFSAAQQRTEVQLRMKVIDTCVNRGQIPVIVGGNIDCKQAQK